MPSRSRPSRILAKGRQSVAGGLAEPLHEGVAEEHWDHERFLPQCRARPVRSARDCWAWFIGADEDDDVDPTENFLGTVRLLTTQSGEYPSIDRECLASDVAGPP